MIIRSIAHRVHAVRCSRPFATDVSDASIVDLCTQVAALGFRRAVLPVRVHARYASHKAQGAVNGVKNGPGKHLGAKKAGEAYVIPGNIIFRQRGTHWWPGENCAMGRDHTIYAMQAGYVRYYKDANLHPDRQYIGVVFERHERLPFPANRARRRRLGKVVVPLNEQSSETIEMQSVDAALEAAAQPATPLQKKAASRRARQLEIEQLQLKEGYMYRQANWEIGRAAEKAGIKVREWRRDDRWTTWKRTHKRKVRALALKKVLAQKKKRK